MLLPEQFNVNPGDNPESLTKKHFEEIRQDVMNANQKAENESSRTANNWITSLTTRISSFQLFDMIKEDLIDEDNMKEGGMTEEKANIISDKMEAARAKILEVRAKCAVEERDVTPEEKEQLIKEMDGIFSEEQV